VRSPPLARPDCNRVSKDRMLYPITSDPQVCAGSPCIRGMRIRVVDVLDMVAAGASRAEILRDYPHLADADITAALMYSGMHDLR